jgi:hypothetical protein
VRITLADLERYDGGAPLARGDERRFCCPLEQCAEKPVDASHRTLCLNVESGAWTCQRCHQSGKLDDGQDAPPQEQRERQRLQRAFAVQAPPAEAKKDPSWRSLLTGLVPIAGTPGEAYLSRRGIPLDLVHAAGVRFSRNWYDREAVVYAIRDRAGALVAAQGRYLDAEKPKTRDAGPKAAGVFATPGAWGADPLVLCEGPADALSLATAGYPSIALMGCAASDVVAWSCAMRTVAVALDADDAGDAAAAKLLPVLAAMGCRAIRLRPADDRDWNDMLLELGPEALNVQLKSALESPGTPLSSNSDAPDAPDGVSGHSDAKPAPEWNAEEQAAWDDTMRQCGACLADAEFIAWVRVQWGCVLMLDGAGKLKAVGAENVPPVVREEVRGRQPMLVKHLQRQGDKPG